MARLYLAILVALLTSPFGAALPLPSFNPVVVPPCPTHDLVEGTLRIPAPPDQYVVVTFRMPQAQVATWGEQVAYVNDGERAISALFLERLDGSAVRRGAGASTAYGGLVPTAQGNHGEVAVLPTTVVNPIRGCNQSAGYDPFRVLDGTYRATLVHASDYGDEAAALIPDVAEILEVRYGPSMPIREAAFTCPEPPTRLVVNGYGSESMVDCEATFGAGFTPYSVVYAGQPRPEHTVQWEDPQGTLFPSVNRFEFHVGGAGDWTLHVPRYVSPEITPEDFDFGVVGAFADVE